MKAALPAIALALVLLTPAAPAAVVVSKDLTRVESIVRVSEAIITGADMQGMVVTANFTNRPPETLVWASTGVDSGGVFGAGWSLSQTGDTKVEAWTFDLDLPALLGNRLVSFTLDSTDLAGQFVGSSPSILFDSASPNPGTDWTGPGTDFDIISGGCPAPSCRATTAVYSQAVALGSATPKGDAFHRLQVNFAAGQYQGLDFQFVLDTDRDERVGSVTVPEPGTTALLAAAALAALLIHRGGVRPRGQRR
jgi:hypothetical protein